MREIRKPSFTDLLLAAGFVELDDDVGFLGFEVGGRIVEGEVAVFADTDEGDVDRGGGDGFADFSDHGGGIFFTVEKVRIGDTGFGDQALFEKFAETRWVRHRQADVLVEVEELDFLPVDAGLGDQGFEKFELRSGAGGNHAGTAALGDGTADDAAGVRGGGFSQRGFLIVNSENHRGLVQGLRLPSSGPIMARMRRLEQR